MAIAEATVQERVGKIECDELLFWEAGDALDIQGKLQAHGAISGRRKPPWPYRQPDDLLARLLALNAERYAPEVALGLYSNAGMQAAKASGGTRRWRTNKGSQE